jgi:hypothetical protein
MELNHHDYVLRVLSELYGPHNTKSLFQLATMLVTGDARARLRVMGYYIADGLSGEVSMWAKRIVETIKEDANGDDAKDDDAKGDDHGIVPDFVALLFYGLYYLMFNFYEMLSALNSTYTNRNFAPVELVQDTYYKRLAISGDGDCFYDAFLSGAEYAETGSVPRRVIENMPIYGITSGRNERIKKLRRDVWEWLEADYFGDLIHDLFGAYIENEYEQKFRLLKYQKFRSPEFLSRFQHNMYNSLVLLEKYWRASRALHNGTKLAKDELEITIDLILKIITDEGANAPPDRKVLLAHWSDRYDLLCNYVEKMFDNNVMRLSQPQRAYLKTHRTFLRLHQDNGVSLVNLLKTDESLDAKKRMLRYYITHNTKDPMSYATQMAINAVASSSNPKYELKIRDKENDRNGNDFHRQVYNEGAEKSIFVILDSVHYDLLIPAISIKNYSPVRFPIDKHEDVLFIYSQRCLNIEKGTLIIVDPAGSVFMPGNNTYARCDDCTEVSKNLYVKFGLCNPAGSAGMPGSAVHGLSYPKHNLGPLSAGEAKLNNNVWHSERSSPSATLFNGAEYSENDEMHDIRRVKVLRNREVILHLIHAMGPDARAAIGDDGISPVPTLYSNVRAFKQALERTMDAIKDQIAKVIEYNNYIYGDDVSHPIYVLVPFISGDTFIGPHSRDTYLNIYMPLMQRLCMQMPNIIFFHNLHFSDSEYD